MRGYCERHAAWGQCDACVAEVIAAAPPDIQRMIRRSRRWEGLHRGLAIAVGALLVLAELAFLGIREWMIWSGR